MKPTLNTTTKEIIFPNIAREGVNIVILAFLIAAIVFAISSTLGILAVALAVGCFYFFRDPERVTPTGKGLVISPADGIVLPIIETSMPDELGGKGGYTRICVFMSVLDVHVNRNPVSGTVLKTVYSEGRFVDVRQDKESEHNERSCTLYEVDGEKIGMVQIAGYVARRIINRLEEGAKVAAGERYGLIKFGSRLDIYLPKDKYEVLVMPGQRMIAGETVLARKKK